MLKKKEFSVVLIVIGGLLIVFWGALHALLIPEIHQELAQSNVDQGIISLITLSYLGITIMISLNGITVILTAVYGIRRNQKWAYFYELSQGGLFFFVSLLLIFLQPKFSLMGFSADFILTLAIMTDIGITFLILIPLLILYKES